MKKSQRRRSSTKETLQLVEWDFDNVAENELAACCLWEYARESQSFAISSAPKVALEATFTVEQQAEEKLRSDYEGFLESYWNCDQGYIEYYETIRNHGGPWSLPWQSISPKVRRLLKKQVGVPELGGPLVPAMLRQLEVLCKENVKEWEAVRNRPRYDPDDNGVGYDPSQPHVEGPSFGGEPHGETIVAFAVDFRRYNNRQICGALMEWLTANRPMDCPEPSRRGQKLHDLRVALDRLGMMRLLHNFTLREMSKSCPEAWKAFAGYEWYKERKRAGLAFRKLFPFLPKAERPLSWPTKGGRSR